MQRLLIVGCGDVVRRILPDLGRHWRLYALVRRYDATLAAGGVTQIVGDLDRPATLQRLAGLADAVLHSAPPPDQGNHDPRTRRLLAVLRRGSLPRRFVYISTTGIYGNCDGDWVGETRGARPASARARRRVDAERLLRRFGRDSACRVSILRAPGIYAGDRLPLDRLRKGLPVWQAGDDVYTNHIHAEDLGRACVAALARGRANRAYNVSDDSTLLMAVWFDKLADAFGLPRPPRVSREALKLSAGGTGPALSPMQLSFMTESRRLANTRLKRELGFRFHYPTVDVSIADALEKTRMLWIKAFHIFFVVSWFAGLFYLPRIFVNLAMVPAGNAVERERLLVMARKLYKFVTPIGLLAVALGLWLWFGYGFTGGWLHVKTTLVVFLLGYHFYCGKLLRDFNAGTNRRSHVWYRFFNEAPVLLLLAICILAVVKPF